MLYFSKLRVFSVLIFTLIISYFTLSNFTKIDDEYFLIGGWFGSKYKRSFWDAYALVKKQLEECKLK